ILLDHLLVERDGLREALLLLRERGADHRAPERAGLAADRGLQVRAREIAVALRARLLRKLAIIVRNLVRLVAAVHLELAVRFDRFFPLALALVDVDEFVERAFGERGAFGELAE